MLRSVNSPMTTRDWVVGERPWRLEITFIPVISPAFLTIGMAIPLCVQYIKRKSFRPEQIECSFLAFLNA
jgi:hypothetical protein